MIKKNEKKKEKAKVKEKKIIVIKKGIFTIVVGE